MTRINTVDVDSLLDQHLIAEYRELPRVINSIVNGKINLNCTIPKEYCLGKGHVTFFYNKSSYLINRMDELIYEMKQRGFKCSFDKLDWDLSNATLIKPIDWTPSDTDKLLNIDRLILRTPKNPRFNCKSADPSWYENIRENYI
jgi:deoxyribonuclease (pyrimidine dimer)